MYRTHFSSPGIVIGYMVRKHPQWMIRFQSGQFDKPDRLFKDIVQEWKQVTTSETNVKELIPQFFMPDQTEFLLNSLNLDFGTTQHGLDVGDVQLPQWTSKVREFLQQNRKALESKYVSHNLHRWIDLIFGHLQKSEEHNNVFHPFSYEENFDKS